MGILERAKNILSANVNALLDKAEDPEKMADQYLREYREDLAEVKKDTASVMAAAEKARRDLEEAKEEAAKYRNAAKNALASGNEADAKTLLARAQSRDADVAELEPVYAQAKQNAENMKAMYQKLVSDIETLERRKDLIKSKAAQAKAQERINQTSKVSDRMSGTMSAFGRMEEKASRMLDEANANASLDAAFTTEQDLMEKYSGGGDASVDAEIEAMKKELGLE